MSNINLIFGVGFAQIQQQIDDGFTSFTTAAPGVRLDITSDRRQTGQQWRFVVTCGAGQGRKVVYGGTVDNIDEWGILAAFRIASRIRMQMEAGYEGSMAIVSIASLLERLNWRES